MKSAPKDCSYDRPCVVKAFVTDIDQPKEFSCSGVLISQKQGLVLTHASLLASLLKKDASSHNLLSDLKTVGYSIRDLKNVFLEVMLHRNNKSGMLSQAPFQSRKVKTFHTELLNCSQSNSLTSEYFQTFQGNTLCVFKCHQFENALEKLLPQDSGWKLYDDNSTPNSTDNKDDIDFFMDKLLPCFVLIGLKSWVGGVNFPIAMMTGSDLRVGDAVEIVATPFGALSPEVFMNSWSRGVLSNLSGPENVLLLTDARCIPGSEGGAVYHSDLKKRFLLGMVVAPLCWKNGEWIGLTVACCLRPVLSCLQKFLASTRSNPLGVSLDIITSDSQLSPTGGGDVCPSVVLVRSGSTWGSGVLIDSTCGLILTCSHVTKWGSNPVALIKFQSVGRWFRASILYCTPAGDLFDLAVLRVEDIPPPGVVTATPSMYTPEAGESVTVTGHAIFDEDAQVTPAVTVGVVSKVSLVNGTPVMIQSTCAVHAGASGGALSDSKGHLLGIVVCNAKDTSTGASFPHINLSVPLQTIWPVLDKYLVTNDSEVLQDLHVTNRQVKKLWNLGGAETNHRDVPKVNSKL